MTEVIVISRINRGCEQFEPKLMEAGKQLREALLTLGKLTGLHFISLGWVEYLLPEGSALGSLTNLR